MNRQKRITTIGLVAGLFIALGACWLPGCVKDEQGNQHVAPSVVTSVLTAAQAGAHALATDYLQTGNVDWKHDLISGALSQVYTLEGTATPATQASVAAAVGNVISDPAMKQAVTDAAVHVINAAPAGTSKNTAIANGIVLLDQEITNLLARYGTAPATGP